MRSNEAYAEEYFERIAILIAENNYSEAVAKAMARSEVLAYARKDGADIQKIMDLIKK
jgi:hypothetical protein